MGVGILRLFRVLKIEVFLVTIVNIGIIYALISRLKTSQLSLISQSRKHTEFVSQRLNNELRILRDGLTNEFYCFGCGATDKPFFHPKKKNTKIICFTSSCSLSLNTNYVLKDFSRAYIRF